MNYPTPSEKRRLARTDQKSTFFLAVCSFALIFLFALPPSISLGQSGSTGWTEPIELNDSVKYGHAWDPMIATDVAGNLHVIWRGWTGSDACLSIGASNTIFYTRWNGREWFDPVDILVPSDPAGDARAGSISVTEDGLVVVAWQSAGRILVSRATIGEATSAWAWSTTQVEVGDYPGLAVNPDSGLWYLTYVSDSASIMFTYSEDNGQTWAPPQIVWSAADGASVPKNEGVYTGRDDGVHLAWTESTARRNWSGEAIWHARASSDMTSFESREVARSASPDQPTLGSPSMAFGPERIAHLFWNNGVGTSTGRFHQWSEDDGVTWSEVASVFPGLSGQTSQAGLAFDSAGVLHLVTAADGDGYGATIRYAIWSGAIWSEYTTLWPGEHGGERPALVITEGNRLHLVWNHDGAAIAYSTRLVSAPYVVPTDLEIAEAVEEGRPEGSVTVLEGVQASRTPVSEVRFGVLPQGQMGTVVHVIWWAIVPTALLVIATVAFRLGRVGSRR